MRAAGRGEPLEQRARLVRADRHRVAAEACGSHLSHSHSAAPPRHATRGAIDELGRAVVDRRLGEQPAREGAPCGGARRRAPSPPAGAVDGHGGQRRRRGEPLLAPRARSARRRRPRRWPRRPTAGRRRRAAARGSRRRPGGAATAPGRAPRRGAAAPRRRGGGAAQRGALGRARALDGGDGLLELAVEARAVVAPARAAARRRVPDVAPGAIDRRQRADHQHGGAAVTANIAPASDERDQRRADRERGRVGAAGGTGRRASPTGTGTATRGGRLNAPPGRRVAAGAGRVAAGSKASSERPASTVSAVADGVRAGERHALDERPVARSEVGDRDAAVGHGDLQVAARERAVGEHDVGAGPAADDVLARGERDARAHERSADDDEVDRPRRAPRPCG